MKQEKYSLQVKTALQIILLLAIAVFNLGPGGSNVAFAAPPLNDNWASATDVPSIPYTDSINTSEATVQTGEPRVNVSCDGNLLEVGNNTVWYKYTPASTGFISFDTVGTDYDTYIAAWTGNAVNNLTLVGCDDDNDVGVTSQLAFTATAGVTYYIQVAKFKCLQSGCSPEPACDNDPDTTCSLTFNAKHQTFVDVPPTHPYFEYIEALYGAGLTAGCSLVPLKFCPATILDRAQMGVFTLRGEFGNTYTPPDPPWDLFADDWSPGPWAEKWAEGMKNANLTAGCELNPLKYCPWTQTTRQEAAVFGMKLKEGSTYTPPNATGTVFADMTNPNFWATKWAEQAYANGLIPSCGTDIGSGKPLFCPNGLVDRGLGAYLVSKAKNLVP
ncbi:MAG TPA: hypothetical protein DCX53_14405 [Anaerolineae bacterium]|nr:hypothetical protein [Anaerolineae bacterium]